MAIRPTRTSDCVFRFHLARLTVVSFSLHCYHWYCRAHQSSLIFLLSGCGACQSSVRWLFYRNYSPISLQRSPTPYNNARAVQLCIAHHKSCSPFSVRLSNSLLRQEDLDALRRGRSKRHGIILVLECGWCPLQSRQEDWWRLLWCAIRGHKSIEQPANRHQIRTFSQAEKCIGNVLTVYTTGTQKERCTTTTWWVQDIQDLSRLPWVILVLIWLW